MFFYLDSIYEVRRNNTQIYSQLGLGQRYTQPSPPPFLTIDQHIFYHNHVPRPPPRPLSHDRRLLIHSGANAHGYNRGIFRLGWRRRPIDIMTPTHITGRIPPPDPTLSHRTYYYFTAITQAATVSGQYTARAVYVQTSVL